MWRRLFLTLPLVLLAQPAQPQSDPAAMPPPLERRGGTVAKRPAMATLRYEDLTPRQRRRAEQAMAREGEADIPAEEVRRRWDVASERDRRRATHRRSTATSGDPARRPDSPERRN